MEKTTTTPDGKTITHIEHPDGRKDVVIGVKFLDIKETDPDSLKAKEIIEDKVLPKLKASMVKVVVLHKPTNKSASSMVPLPQVRAYAEAAISAFPDDKNPDNFVVIEVHEGSFLTRVSTLNELK